MGSLSRSLLRVANIRAGAGISAYRASHVASRKRLRFYRSAAPVQSAEPPSLRDYFHSRYSPPVSSQRKGLFGVAFLQDTTGFESFFEYTKEQAAVAVRQIASSDENDDVVGLLDNLSDLLCKLADLSHAVWQLHPDEAYKNAAGNACVKMDALIEELNTDSRLYEALVRHMKTENYQNRDEETKRTAENFLHDFEKSGIHLNSQEKSGSSELSNLVTRLQMLFETTFQNVGQEIRCQPEDIPGLPEEYKNAAAMGKLPTWNPGVAQMVLVTSPNPDCRKKVYYAMAEANEDQQQVLRNLLLARLRYAQSVGYESYAHKELKDTMVQNPETANSFLTEFASL